MVAIDRDGKYLPMPHRTEEWVQRLDDPVRFKPRVDTDYDSIVRHGSRPRDYWWEVYDRRGVVHRYGHYETMDNSANQSTLRDANGNIARWCLTESEDANGNLVLYLYDTVRDAGSCSSTVKGVQIYPAVIRYTGYRNGDVVDPGRYRIEFIREDNDRARRRSFCYQTQTNPGIEGVNYPSRIPATVNCRLGLKEVTASLLSHIYVYASDTVTRAWYFGMRYGSATGYRMLLHNIEYKPVSIAEFDNNHYIYGEKGIMYRGDCNQRSYLQFDYYPAPSTLFGEEVDMGAVWSNHAGGGDPYGMDVRVTGFKYPVSPSAPYTPMTTALGVTKGFGWNAGGGLDVGFGLDVFWTELSAGANCNLGRSHDESWLTMTDIDGDGLPDKVYKGSNGINYRRHIRINDSMFYFGESDIVQGLESILSNTGKSQEYGLQASFGASLTGSLSLSTSHTTEYFADVNGDGLSDMVTDRGVYFNSPVGGVPRFVRAERHSADGMTDSVQTTTMPCGTVLYGGEINDSVYCHTVVEDTIYVCRECTDSVSEYVINNYFIGRGWTEVYRSGDTIFGRRFKIVCGKVPSGLPGGFGSGDAVRVWVAPATGNVTVLDSIRMIADTAGGLRRSRNADGVRYSVQWEHDVHNFSPVANNFLHSTNCRPIRALSGSLDPCDTAFVIRDTTFNVQRGDLLMFRLGSGDNTNFDRADWRHTVTYNEIPDNNDIYGRPQNRYNSREDFIVSGKDHFMAPCNGIVKMDIGMETGTLMTGDTDNDFDVQVWYKNGQLWSQTVSSNFQGTLHVEWPNRSYFLPVHRGDTVAVKLRSSGATTWGNVVCRPELRFYPGQNCDVKDTVVCRLAAKVVTSEHVSWAEAYNRLFGPLYRGWGQFAYVPDPNHPDDSIWLATLVYNIGTQTTSDTGAMRNIITNVDGETFTFDELMNGMDNTNNYNPLSTSNKRWRRMEPDSRNQVWSDYGLNCTLGRTLAANVCPQEFHAEGAAAGIMEIDCPAPDSSTSYPHVRTHSKSSSGRVTNLSGSIGAGSISMYKSRSNGTTVTTSDFLDLNGDRYPDIAGVGMVQYTMPYGGLSPNVTAVADTLSCSRTSSESDGVSAGSGRQMPEHMFGKTMRNSKMGSLPDRPDESVNLSGVSGSETVPYSIADINGDGLPDRILPNGHVQLNIGYKFLGQEDMGIAKYRDGGYTSLSVSAGASVPEAFNVAILSIGGGVNIGVSDNRTGFLLVDINGDGLPDKIERNSNTQNVSVRYNLGNGQWSSPVSLGVGEISHGTGFNESINASVTAGGTLAFLKVTGTVNGSPALETFSSDNAQFADVNGDGLPDYVTSKGEGDMKVRHNHSGKTGLLRTVRYLGDTLTELAYEFRTPEYDNPTGQWVLSSCLMRGDTAMGVPDRLTTFSYASPRYDRYERTDCGYGEVSTCEYTVGVAGSRVPYRRTTVWYRKGSYHLRGRISRELVSAADGSPYEEKLYNVVSVDNQTGDTVGEADCPLVTHPLLERTLVNHYEGRATAWQTTAESYKYDSRRNVVAYIDWGDTNYNGDEARADIEYHGNYGRNLISLKKNVTVRRGSVATAPLMRKSEYIYDSRGRMTRRGDWYRSDAVAKTDYNYDIYGNIDTVKMPPNSAGQRMKVSIKYDSFFHSVPVEIKDTLGRVSRSGIDRLLGLPLFTVSPTGDTVKYVYDSMGRTIRITAPRELAAHAPYTWKAEYRNNATLTSRYDERHPDNPMQTAVICDRWGHTVQVKEDVDISVSEVMRVSGRTKLDALWRAVETHDPFPGSTVAPFSFTSTATTLRTKTDYDLLDRTVACSTYHLGTPRVETRNYGYAAFGNRTLMFTQTIDPLGNRDTAYTCPRGLTVRTADAEGGVSLFVYDPLGQLLECTDPEGFTTAYTYDMAGRVTSRDHPDAGVTLWEYDAAGNMTSTTSAEGETVQTEYEFNRPVRKTYPRLTRNNVVYRYNDAGLPDTIRFGGGLVALDYDALGNVVSERRTLAVPSSPDAYTFTTDYVYDSWGRTLSMTYPDGEEVTYFYDRGGNLSSMRGVKNNVTHFYINSITYDFHGDRTRVTYGNGSETRYTYDDLRRLSRMRTYALQGLTPVTLQDIQYTFDDADCITSLANSAVAVGTMGGTYTNSFTYDALYRLTLSTQNFAAGNTGETMYTPSGRLCGRKNTFSHSTLYYGYITSERPHAPRRIYNSSEGNVWELRWDGCGNLGQADLFDLNDGLQKSRFLFWTEDSRLHTVVDKENYSYYAYDNAGERYLKLTGTNSLEDNNANNLVCTTTLREVTLYASPFLVATNTGYTKHYYAGSDRVCATDGGGGLDYLGTFFSRNDTLAVRTNQLLEQCAVLARPEQLEKITAEDVEYPCKEDFGEDPDPPVEVALTKEFETAQSLLEATVSANTRVFQLTMGLYSIVEQGENNIYYYHGDHLGGASWITDASGQPIQHLQYLPFGETFVNQQSSSYSERYTFTGKEKDSETGFYNFGARYYDSDLSGLFLSVDPMADKYPNISPYAYCAWNPVKLVDPNGREVLPTSEEAYQMILTSLPQEARAYVKRDANGFIDRDLINSYNCESQNFQDLQDLVNLDDCTIEVAVSSSYNWINSEGELVSTEMSYSNPTIEAETLKGFGITYTPGVSKSLYSISTGESGEMGVTALPVAAAGHQSTNGNIQVTINSKLSIKGKAETFAHEFFGHAYLFATTGDYNRAAHGNSQPGMEDSNIELKNRIIRAKNEAASYNK